MSNHRAGESNSSQGRSRRGRGRRSRGGGNSSRDGRAARANEFPDDEPFEDEIDDDDPDAERLHVTDLKLKSPQELTELGEELAVENAAGLRKQDLIFEILKAQTEKKGLIYAEGTLETLPDGFGFLRAPDQNYLAGPDDIYVSPVRRLKRRICDGDT